MKSHLPLPMQGINAVIPLIIALFAGQAAQGASPRPAEKQQAPWTALGLERTNLGASSFYYEKSLVSKVEAVKKIYQQFGEDEMACRQQAETLWMKPDDIIRELNGLIGGKSSVEKQENQKGILIGMIKAAAPISQLGKRFTLCLANRTAIKDYLRKGGKLPGFTYDSSSDTVHQSMGFKYSSDTNASEPFTLVIAVIGLETVESDAQEMFSALLNYPRTMPVLALHELAEAALFDRLRPRVPFYRWFDEGMANVLALRLARQFMGETAAQSYADGLRTDSYGGLADALNLRYWLAVDPSVETPLEIEDKLSNARYAYATLEAERLIANRGVGCLARILNRASPLDAYHDLLAAIKEVTGEDVAERLNRYQRFKTPAEGVLIYAQAIKAASARKDFAEAIPQALRLIELHGGDELQDYALAALCLAGAGHLSWGDRVFEREIKLLDGRGLIKPSLQCKKLFATYAVVCNRPSVANTAAEEVLLHEPDCPDALAVRMFRLAAEAKPSEARKVAQRIRESGIDRNSPAYKATARFVSEDKSAGPDSKAK